MNNQIFWSECRPGAPLHVLPSSALAASCCSPALRPRWINCIFNLIIKHALLPSVPAIALACLLPLPETPYWLARWITWNLNPVIKTCRPDAPFPVWEIIAIACLLLLPVFIKSDISKTCQFIFTLFSLRHLKTWS